MKINNPKNNIDSSDEEITNEEQPNAPSVNTLLVENTIDPNKNILCIAPAEGQKPIFTDADTEYLCFPTIFCGKRRNNNKYHKLTKREIFKYEIRSVDRRVSTNIPNIQTSAQLKKFERTQRFARPTKCGKAPNQARKGNAKVED